MFTTQGHPHLKRFRGIVSALSFLLFAAFCLGQIRDGEPLAASAVTPKTQQSNAVNGTNIYVFPADGREGGEPEGKLTFDSNGNLYGTTFGGGGFDTNCPFGWCGTAFELSPNNDGTWSETEVYDFPRHGKEGANPVHGVILDDRGNLYGTTWEGGYWDCHPTILMCGVVFEVTPNASGQWVETVLYAFTGRLDGAIPGALTFDKAGNLYGTAASGGNAGCGGSGCGVVFELSPTVSGQWQESVIHTFTGGSDGANPSGGLTWDGSGNLYGATSIGGGGNCNDGCGVVFELMPNGNGGWTEKVLYDFGKTTEEGAYPNGDLTFDSAGNLYGSAQGGSSNFGVAFELTPTATGKWKQTLLHTFTGGHDGLGPSSLAIDGNGNLYGTTYAGGIGNCYGGCGVVYKLAQQQGGWRLTVLHSFSGGEDGGNPTSALTIDATGNLFGSTSSGGANLWGTIFELTP